MISKPDIMRIFERANRKFRLDSCGWASRHASQGPKGTQAVLYGSPEGTCVKYFFILRELNKILREREKILRELDNILKELNKILRKREKILRER